MDDAGTLSPECQTFLKTRSASPPAPRASPQPSLNGALEHVFSELLPLPSVEQYHLRKGRCSKQLEISLTAFCVCFRNPFIAHLPKVKGGSTCSFPRGFATRRGLL